jgi:hypothetical protein
VREACDASLKRLGVDCIISIISIRLDRKTPIEETVGAMAEPVRQGKVGPRTGNRLRRVQSARMRFPDGSNRDPEGLKNPTFAATCPASRATISARTCR